jgi:hypothetical protein
VSLTTDTWTSVATELYHCHWASFDG